MHEEYDVHDIAEGHMDASASVSANRGAKGHAGASAAAKGCGGQWIDGSMGQCQWYKITHSAGTHPPFPSSDPQPGPGHDLGHDTERNVNVPIVVRRAEPAAETMDTPRAPPCELSLDPGDDGTKADVDLRSGCRASAEAVQGGRLGANAVPKRRRVALSTRCGGARHGPRRGRDLPRVVHAPSAATARRGDLESEGWIRRIKRETTSKSHSHIQ